MWKCNNCGKEVIYIVATSYKVKKNLKKEINEKVEGTYWCPDCGVYNDLITNIAEWVEE